MTIQSPLLEQPSIRKHPKFEKVIALMKGESIETVQDLLFEVISECKSLSKVI